MAFTFTAVKQGSVKNRVAEAIRNAIYSGKLHPGDPLLELQLARDFRVSQTSVREALIHLEQLGLVRRFPNKGTVVTELTPQQVRERLEIRMPMECMAALQAASKMDEKHAAELFALADRIGDATARKDFYAAAQADLDFHRTIWRLSGNETLCQILDQIAAPLFAFVSIVRSTHTGHLPSVLHSHREIVEALASRDTKLIRDTIENHFAGSYEHFLRAAPASGSNFA